MDRAGGTTEVQRISIDPVVSPCSHTIHHNAIQHLPHRSQVDPSSPPHKTHLPRSSAQLTTLAAWRAASRAACLLPFPMRDCRGPGSREWDEGERRGPSQGGAPNIISDVWGVMI